MSNSNSYLRDISSLEAIWMNSIQKRKQLQQQQKQHK